MAEQLTTPAKDGTIKEPQVKDKNIHIRVTEDQHTAIMQQARKLGMTVSAYILMLTEGSSK